MCQGIIVHPLLCALQKYCHQLDLRWGVFITAINVIQRRQEDTQVTWLEGDALTQLEIVLKDTVLLGTCQHLVMDAESITV